MLVISENIKIGYLKNGEINRLPSQHKEPSLIISCKLSVNVAIGEQAAGDRGLRKSKKGQDENFGIPKNLPPIATRLPLSISPARAR